MQNGRKRLFPNGDVFVSHGYDFFDSKIERHGEYQIILTLLMLITFTLSVYGDWIESGPDMEQA
jgi:hypothetical protein